MSKLKEESRSNCHTYFAILAKYYKRISVTLALPLGDFSVAVMGMPIAVVQTWKSNVAAILNASGVPSLTPSRAENVCLRVEHQASRSLTNVASPRKQYFAVV